MLTLCVSLTMAQSKYRPDILGEGFEQRTIDLPDEADGDLFATLVRRQPIREGASTILYIHGYNDYFFQEWMAERFTDSLYNFYALDLRRYGRSLRPEHLPFQVGALTDYFNEISQAVEIIRHETYDAEITLMGHSTGGLIASLYAHKQDQDPLPRVDALILNSPFLDMNLPPVVEGVALPVVSAIGGLMPHWVVITDGSKAYFDSLDSSQHGEWSYDTNLKYTSHLPTTAGWLRAIHHAQQTIQDSPNISIPILLMHSDKSVVTMEWIPECQVSDMVLSVKDMARYGLALGDSVTHVVIEDGMHDLVLSGVKAREATYAAMFKFLRKQQPQEEE